MKRAWRVRVDWIGEKYTDIYCPFHKRPFDRILQFVSNIKCYLSWYLSIVLGGILVKLPEVVNRPSVFLVGTYNLVEELAYFQGNVYTGSDTPERIL